jgi:hypothetical protein
LKIPHHSCIWGFLQKSIECEDLARLYLWYNSDIKIGQKLVFYESWAKAGINYMQNLIDNEGKWATKKYLEKKYNFRINFLEYESLKSAIPTKWKKVLINDSRTINYVILQACRIKISGNEK